MKLTKLNLVNFRNYSKLEIKFNSSMNIFVGDNAQGKTNILESVIILALTKSFKDTLNSDVIKFEKDRAKILGTIKNDGIISKLEINIDKESKNLFINKTPIKRAVDYLSNLNLIVFTPNDLDIIKGSPSVRRNLLNIQLSQISKNYLKIFGEYSKILKNRNEYLKVLYYNNIADKKYLDILTDKLIDRAIYLYRYRKEYINKINEHINYYYQKLTGENGIFIKYVNSIEFENYDEEYLKEKLHIAFKKNYDRDLKYGITNIGPHRDDFNIYLNGKDLKIFGSQGQQKMSVLAFKLSEIPIFYEYSKTNPVVLLDDIFSELDIKKRNKLLKLINNDEVQTIITTTDLKNINKNYIKNSYVYVVKDGIVNRK